MGYQYAWARIPQGVEGYPSCKPWIRAWLRPQIRPAAAPTGVPDQADVPDSHWLDVGIGLYDKPRLELGLGLGLVLGLILGFKSGCCSVLIKCLKIIKNSLHLS